MKHLARLAALAAAALAVLATMTTAASAQTKTLDAVKQRGQLVCGVNVGLLWSVRIASTRCARAGSRPCISARRLKSAADLGTATRFSLISAIAS